MQYCVDHPEEISKLAKVKAQVSEVKGVMMENIEKVEKQLLLLSHPYNWVQLSLKIEIHLRKLHSSLLFHACF